MYAWVCCRVVRRFVKRVKKEKGSDFIPPLIHVVLFSLFSIFHFGPQSRVSERSKNHMGVSVVLHALLINQACLL